MLDKHTPARLFLLSSPGMLALSCAHFFNNQDKYLWGHAGKHTREPTQSKNKIMTGGGEGRFWKMD